MYNCGGGNGGSSSNGIPGTPNNPPVITSSSYSPTSSNEYHLDSELLGCLPDSCPAYWIHPETDLVNLIGSGSDPDNDTLTYTWTLIDRQGTSVNEFISNNANAIFTPTVDSSSCVPYTIELEVSDGKASDLDYIVFCALFNQAPDADAGNDKIAGPRVPIDPPFNASNSDDQDGIVIRYTWDFGDGDFYSESTILAEDGLFDGVADINKAYSSIGDYEVTVTVEDDDGATKSAIAWAYIF